MSTKRILSLVLALVMVLGTFGTVFAAPTANEKAEFLKSKGILIGNDSGDLTLEKVLIREHAAVLLSRLYGNKDVDVVDVEMPFTDVNGVGAPFVAWAYNEGLIAGNSATTFNPGGPLTAQQFASLLLRALGYEATLEAYESAFEDAKELGIFAGVTVGETDQLNRAEMAEMTYNALEVKLADDSQTLAKKLGIVMPGTDEYVDATELKVKSVTTENLAEMVVELSNTVQVETNDQMLNPANYRIKNASGKLIPVHNVRQEGKKLILTVIPYGRIKAGIDPVDVLVKGQKYSLTIRNVDPRLNVTIKGIEAKDNHIPEVKNVEFMGDYGIKVTTSEPIANPQERDFRLDGRTVMFVEQYGRDIILTPYYDGPFNKEAVELEIDILNDFAGYKTTKAPHAMELSDDEGLPQVVAAYRTGSKVVVEFDRDVFWKSVKGKESRLKLGNISFVERNVPFYVEGTGSKAEKINTNIVEYTFDREIPRGTVVEIKDVANHFNKAMVTDSVVLGEFFDDNEPVIVDWDGEVELTVAEQTRIENTAPYKANWTKNIWVPGVEDVKTDAMRVEFDKDIYELKHMTLAQLNANKTDFFQVYRLDITTRGRADAAGVEFKVVDKGSDWIEVAFEDIWLNNKNKDYDYILEVKNFSDMNRLRMRMDYLDFEVVERTAPFAINSISIVPNRYFNRQGTEIILSFNTPVNKLEAREAKNYFIDGLVGRVSEAVVENDGKTVSLIIYDRTPSQVKETYGLLEVSARVTDINDRQLKNNNRFWNLKTETSLGDVLGVDPIVKELTYIVSTSADNLVVKYDGELYDAAKMSDDVTEFLFNFKTMLENQGVKFGMKNGKLDKVVEITLDETTYNMPADATIKNNDALNGLTIIGKGTDKTTVDFGTKDFEIEADNVTIKELNLKAGLITVSGDNFTSKTNLLESDVTVTGNNASFNTEITGTLTIEGSGAVLNNVEVNKLVVKAGAEVALAGTTEVVSLEVEVGAKVDVKNALKDLQEAVEDAVEDAKKDAEEEELTEALDRVEKGVATNADYKLISGIDINSEIRKVLNAFFSAGEFAGTSDGNTPPTYQDLELLNEAEATKENVELAVEGILAATSVVATKNEDYNTETHNWYTIEGGINPTAIKALITAEGSVVYVTDDSADGMHLNKTKDYKFYALTLSDAWITIEVKAD